MNQKSTTYCSDIIYDFAEMYGNGYFSDCTIVLQNPPTTIYAHRAVLANWSNFFKDGFTSGMEEDKKRRIELEFNPNNKLPELINFMYTEKIEINPSNLMPLIDLANHYDVPTLLEGLKSKLYFLITEKNVLYFVQECYEHKLHYALSVISKHVSRLYSSLDRKEFTNTFDVETFCTILKDAVLEYHFDGNVKMEINNFMQDDKPKTQKEADALNSLNNLSKDVNLIWKIE